ncbi:S-adenosyl-L-methionine-dependent methyltransferase [Cyathus striatus]|nr:S-adenosyl-L-methionine-dependent methyltransferase [Cyathus striatus]
MNPDPLFSLDSDSDTDSEALSIVSFPRFSDVDSEASSRTSYEQTNSNVSHSPALSIMSMSSSLRSQVYKQEYGRDLNNYSEVYRLPADDEEMHRLEQQHLMFVDLMGGKYPEVMAEIMADDGSGERKACLDIGCGSGNWIMDVARDFPNCNAVGVDLVPMQSPSMPPNLRSEIDDVNLGLEHFYGDFNVVHARLISAGIKDYYRVIDQISHVLRPGGLIDVSEFDFHVYDINHQRFEPNTHQVKPPWWAQWLKFLAEAVGRSGGQADAATHLHDWISNHPAFEDVVYRDVWIPIIPSPTATDFQRRMASIMYEDVHSFLGSGRPLLLGSGLPEDLVLQMEENVKKELDDGIITEFTRLQCVHARKKRTTHT